MNEKIYFNRLIETIKLVAAPADVQLSLFPDQVCKSDEIALTYDEFASKVDGCRLLSEPIKQEINELNILFSRLNKDEWSEEAVKDSPAWGILRKKASNILLSLNIEYTTPRLFWIKDI